MHFNFFYLIISLKEVKTMEGTGNIVAPVTKYQTKKVDKPFKKKSATKYFRKKR